MQNRPERIIIAICAAGAAVQLARAVSGHLIMPRFVPLTKVMLAEPLHWVAWIAFARPIAWAVTRHPIGGDRRGSLAVHAGVMLAFAPLVGAIQATATYVLMIAYDTTPERAALMRWNPAVAIPGQSLAVLWDYVAIVGLASAFRYYDQARERQLRAAELERDLTTAKLEALQSQLHPHFLFNVLHSTALLVTTNAGAARDMLLRLSDLLRRTLGSDRRLEVTLAEELDVLDRYLQIERMRFGDRLAITYDVGDDSLDCLVPSLMLQPLAENAIRHGLSRESTPGRLTIRGRIDDGRLALDIEDDGAGVPTDWDPEVTTGVGLSNVRARLSAGYGPAASMTFERGTRRGLRVRVILPIKRPAA